MEDCLFCKIARGELSPLIYEDEYVAAFNDIDPQAPVHFLVVPKQHIESMNDITPENSFIIARIAEAIPEICRRLGVVSYRVVNNNGEDAGQSVKHLHFHVLAGRSMQWPPG